MEIINAKDGKEIEGIVIEDKSVSIDLTSVVVDVIVKFIYSKIKGSITILYLDEEGNEIAERTVMENLPLGTYEITAKDIEGYKLITK